MNTPIPAAAERAEPVTLPVTAWAALQQEARWLTASDAEREVLQRIAMQRDRLHASRQARAQAKALSAQVQAVSADAPLAERLLVFAPQTPALWRGGLAFDQQVQALKGSGIHWHAAL